MGELPGSALTSPLRDLYDLAAVVTTLFMFSLILILGIMMVSCPEFGLRELNGSWNLLLFGVLLASIAGHRAILNRRVKS